MSFKGLRIWVLFMLAVPAFALSILQNKPNPFELPLIQSCEAYHETIKDNPDKELVDIEYYVYGLVLDIKYATHDNFVGKPMYQQPKAYLRRSAAQALGKAQQEFESMGLCIKVFDAYRPYEVTVAFYAATDKKQFVANPKDGSRHNRGCAVDITLVDAGNLKELLMPTPFDDFTEKAAPSYSNLSDEQIRNRDLLIRIMAKHGFKVHKDEWWHFDFTGWQNYELLDLSFEELELCL
jgi:D-alanyl-D-alanine dipeptidase